MPLLSHFQLLTFASFSPLFHSFLLAFPISFRAKDSCQSHAYNVQGTVPSGGVHQQDELAEIFVCRGMIWGNEKAKITDKI